MLEILVSIVVIVFIIEALLDFLNQRSAVLPPDPLVAGLYDAKERNRSIEYGAAKYRVGLVSGTGILLSILVLIRGGVAEFKIPIAEVRSAAILGCATLAMGIGAVSIAQTHVPSGVVSLIIAALPLWIALFRTVSGERIAKSGWIGTIIGFLGVVLLLKPGGIESVSGEDSTGVLLVFKLLS